MLTSTERPSHSPPPLPLLLKDKACSDTVLSAQILGLDLSPSSLTYDSAHSALLWVWSKPSSSAGMEIKAKTTAGLHRSASYRCYGLAVLKCLCFKAGSHTQIPKPVTVSCGSTTDSLHWGLKAIKH